MALHNFIQTRKRAFIIQAGKKNKIKQTADTF